MRRGRAGRRPHDGSWSTRAAADRPGQPWLEPDIGAYLREIRSDVVIVPIGFLSDHMEVLYDLDTEARAVCEELGVKMVRAGTAGTHPAMIEMIAEMVEQEHARVRGRMLRRSSTAGNVRPAGRTY